MTCIGAIKWIEGREVKVIMGSDSCLAGDIKYSGMHVNKIIRGANCLIGVAGSIRVTNIIDQCSRYAEDSAFLFPYDFGPYEFEEPYNYMVDYFIKELREKLDNANAMTKGDSGEDMHSQLLVAFAERLFFVDTDFSVIEVKEYAAIGSGYVAMMSALHATKKNNTDARTRIEKGLESAAAHYLDVAPPWQFAEITFDCGSSPIFSL